LLYLVTFKNIAKLSIKSLLKTSAPLYLLPAFKSKLRKSTRYTKSLQACQQIWILLLKS